MEPLQRTKQNPMAAASFILGMIAIVFSLRTPAYALFSGCLSILFAVLSRGSGFKMPDKAIAGLIISAFAIIIAALIFIAALFLQEYLVQSFGEEVLQDPNMAEKLMLERINDFLNQLQAGGTGL